MLFVQLIGVVLILFYVFVKRKQSYWKVRGVPHVTPEFFWGNSKGIESAYHPTDFFLRMYMQLKSKGPITGIYLFTEPIAFITNIELAKRIYITDFNFFYNRGAYINEPATVHLVNVEDEKWRNLRQKMMPFFRSKQYRKIFQDTLKFTDIFISKLATESPCELNDLTTRLMIDFFGMTFFSRNFKQLECPVKEISRTIRLGMKFSFTSKTIAESYSWLLADIFRIKITPKKVIDYFKDLVSEEIKARREEDKDDFLGLLIKMHKSESDLLSNDEVWTNAAMIMNASQENTISALKHTLYELSKRPDVQCRLRDSIKETLKDQEELTYDSIIKIKFLNQCVDETLRMYSASLFTKRVAKYDYKVPDTNITIEKGTSVIFPFYAFHNDSDIFENPEVWNPDRKNLSAVTPFGIGPRICIGFQLALMIVKTTVAKLVLDYELSLDNERTPSKLMMNSRILLRSSKGIHDIYLMLKKI